MAEIRVSCWRCKGKCQEFGWAKPGDKQQTWHNCPACGGKGWVMGTVIEGAGCVIVERRSPVESAQEAMRRLTMEFLEDLNGGPVEDITDQIAISDKNSGEVRQICKGPKTSYSRAEVVGVYQR